MSDLRTLLPLNASAGERRVEATLALANDVPVPIRDFWRVDDCPVDLLPWLAAERSVDLWRSEWPLELRRNLIRAAYAAHARKGTPAAIRDALAILGASSRIVEWWQEQPRGIPNTAKVQAFFRPGGIMPGSTEHLPDELVAIAREIVTVTKRFSIPVETTAGLMMGQDLTLAQGGSAALRLSGNAAGRHPMRRAGLTRCIAQGGQSAMRLSGSAKGQHPARIAAALRSLGAAAHTAIRLTGTAFAVPAAQ